MLEEITGIKINGANFSDSTKLDFFKKKNKNSKDYVNLSLIFGRNGAGKSTIARAFRKIKGDSDCSFKTELIDENGKNLLLRREELSKIHVFDENFVNNQVALRKTGMDTIIMLGEKVELTNKIEQAEKDLSDKEKELKDFGEELNQLEDNQNPKSPYYYLDKIENSLRGGWAVRDCQIKNNKVNTRVNDETYRKFINRKPKEENEELMKEFNKKLLEIEKNDESGIPYKTAVPELPNLSFNDNQDKQLKMLLKQKIQSHKLSDKEKQIISFFSDENGVGKLEEKLEFLKTKSSICPYCYQDLTADYKKDLIENINNILNKEVEDFKQKLEKCKSEEINFNLEQFENIKGYKECIDSLNSINTHIKENNQKIDQKIGNPFVIIEPNRFNVADDFSKLESNLQYLEKNRQIKIKSERDTTNKIKKRLNDINSDITYNEIKEYLNAGKEKKDNFIKMHQSIENCEKEVQKFSKEINDLNAKRKNVDIAVEQINNYIDYIFFSGNRLELKCNSDKEYVLLSRGKPVTPDEISQGEKNIIGLCYFFVKLMQNKNKKDAFKESCLIVIDDPISSFDFENKIGILSFLKYMIEKILSNNLKSKILIMTHDFSTFFNLNKLLSELRKSYRKKIVFNEFQLIENDLKNIELSKYQEYDKLLLEVYKFAKGSNTDVETIGNVMRQLLEAFSTFEYEVGISDISTKSEIIKNLPDGLKGYFSTFAYRFVLNGGSHKENEVKGMEDMNFFDKISTKEKRRSAQHILCLIWLLNKSHILAHFTNICNQDVDIKCDEVKRDLEKWEKEIEEHNFDKSR